MPRCFPQVVVDNAFPIANLEQNTCARSRQSRIVPSRRYTEAQLREAATVGKFGSGFDPETYAPVAERIRLFYQAHPLGRIVTDLVRHEDGQVVFKALVYRTPGTAGTRASMGTPGASRSLGRGVSRASAGTGSRSRSGHRVIPPGRSLVQWTASCSRRCGSSALSVLAGGWLVWSS
jgi:hypothetical protein